MTRWGPGCLALALACGAPPAPPERPARLVDAVDVGSLENPAPPVEDLPRTEWRFANGAGGWQAGPGVPSVSVREEKLVGRTNEAVGLVHAAREGDLGSPDVLHAIEVRARVSAGKRMTVRLQGQLAPGEIEEVAAQHDAPFWGYTAELEPGKLRTYVIAAKPQLTRKADTRHVIVRPSDAAGAAFEIESVRLVFRREHLAGLASGVGWHGLAEVYREALAARAGEAFVVPVTVPAEPWLDLALGMLGDGAVTLAVELEADGTRTPLLQRTLTTPDRWEPAPLELPVAPGATARLRLSMESAHPDSIGFFGSPVVRSRVRRGDAARIVILVLADTLRADHLDAYGYRRPTAPNLARAAGEGTLFERTVSQGSWTKVSTPSIVTSLYQRSHGVTAFPARLSDEAETLAELFRDAGYATIGFSSVFFTGGFSNMQQGYEVFHESTSYTDPHYEAKNARSYVDRLLAFIEGHRDVPVFAFLHVFDPHDPFEPREPYASLWADPAGRQRHHEDVERTRPLVANPVRRAFGVPGEDDLRRAGVDPRAFIEHVVDWYDGSIHGMDVELARVFERLEALGLTEETVVAFTSDHGEEFHEHGQMFHGHSLHGELIDVPLFFWAPGRVPAGVRVDAPVESIDVAPTLLELARIPAPAVMQGRSLTGFFGGARPPAGRAVFSEKVADPEGTLLFDEVDSVAVVQGRWKLIRSAVGEEPATLELFDVETDPFEKRSLTREAPDVVTRLLRELDEWEARTADVRLAGGEIDMDSLSDAERERLRSLGYLE